MHPAARAIAGFLVASLFGSAPAATPQLVRNINTVPIGVGSTPVFLGEMGGAVYFSATTPTTGRELWKSDGTEAGTVLVRDIEPGADSSDPESFIVAGNVAYFSAKTRAEGNELWVTDGTADGTRLVADIVAGTGWSNPAPLAIQGSTLYFAAVNGSTGNRLRRTDGTAAGTVDLGPFSPFGIAASFMVSSATLASNGRLYFSGYLPNGAPKLWRSDGSVGGTVPMPDPANSESPSGFVEAGGHVYFTQSSGGVARLWRIRLSDEALEDVTTNAGVANLSVEVGPVSVGNAVVFGGRLNGVLQLWRSDGTVSGTFPLVAMNTQLGNSYVNPRFTRLANRVIFVTVVEGSPVAYGTDGTAAGTEVISPMPGVSRLLGVAGPRAVLVVDGRTFRTDGTRAGTIQIEHPPEIGALTAARWIAVAGDSATIDLLGNYLLPGSVNTDYQVYRYVVATGGWTLLRRFASAPGEWFGRSVNRLFFSASQVATGMEPWTSDGTVDGTRLLRNVAIEPTESGSAPGSFFSFQGRAYFVANDGGVGRELWRSDGTSAGTELVADLLPGPADSEPSSMFSAGSSLLFYARESPAFGAYLWRYEPAANALQVIRASEGPTNSCTRAVSAPVRGNVFFGTSLWPSLWRTDGTAGGTLRLDDVPFPGPFATPCNLTAYGDHLLYFVLQSGVESGYGLWRSDGTGVGTERIALFATEPTFVRVLRGLAYFSSSQGSGARSLWQSDGTAAGTVVAAVYPPQMLTAPAFVGEVNGRLLFTAGTAAGSRLWTFDPVSASFTLIQSPAHVATGPISADGSTVFFTGLDANGVGPWVTDGTNQGTRPLLATTPGQVTLLQWVADFRNLGIFLMRSGAGPVEYWRSDGTSARTSRISTLPAGQSVVNATLGSTVAGDRLFFSVFDPAIGAEPYSLENEAPIARPDAAIALTGQAVTIPVLDNDSDLETALDAASVTIVNAPQQGVAAVGPDGRIVYFAPAGFTGSQSFAYSVRDRQGRSATTAAIVTVTVNAVTAPPGAATPLSPAGLISDTAPTFRWGAITGAQEYLLWVDHGGASPRVRQWVSADAAGCGSGLGECRWTSTTSLSSGSGRWWVQTWNSVGYGPWSSGMSFTVASAPSEATLSSPNGAAGTQPTYTWQAVGNAEEYLLWVDDQSGVNRVRQWVSASAAGCAGGTGTCSYTPSTSLPVGRGRFYVQTWNRLGYGPWSIGMTFYVGGLPAAATLVSPSGTITTSTPQYRWNAVPGAEEYLLWVDDSGARPKVRRWYTAAQAGCANGTGVCGVTPSTTLAVGSGQWWIQTWNPVGYGPWSSAMSVVR